MKVWKLRIGVSGWCKVKATPGRCAWRYIRGREDEANGYPEKVGAADNYVGPCGDGEAWRHFGNEEIQGQGEEYACPDDVRVNVDYPKLGKQRHEIDFLGVHSIRLVHLLVSLWR